MSQSDGGKGDSPRPFTDRQQFEDNWDRIFRQKAKENPIKEEPLKEDEND